MGDVSLRTGPPTLPLEWLPFPPLVTAVLITPKGAESPDSGHIGVIGASVFFSTSEAVQDKRHSPWPADSWNLSHLGYLYPGTTPVMLKLHHNRSCPWV